MKDTERKQERSKIYEGNIQPGQKRQSVQSTLRGRKKKRMFPMYHSPCAFTALRSLGSGIDCTVKPPQGPDEWELGQNICPSLCLCMPLTLSISVMTTDNVYVSLVSICSQYKYTYKPFSVQRRREEERE